MDFFYLSGFGAYFESFVPFKKAVQHQYLFFFGVRVDSYPG